MGLMFIRGKTFAQKLSVMPGKMIVFMSAIVSLTQLVESATPISMNANCPLNCVCDDETFTAICQEVGLSEAPITLNPSLERLILKRNKIKTVEAAAFQFYKALKYVDFSENQIMRIPPNVFALQSKLMELHLNNNRISNIGDKTFYGLKSLTVLNLRNNFLEELPDKVFIHLTNLIELDLSQNRLSRISLDTFEGLNKLRVLHLDDNQLVKVPTPSFGHLGSLAELKIGLNSFSTLPNDCFKGLSNLILLDMSKNPLPEMGEHCFRGLATLRTLVMLDNNLSAVPRQLSKLPRLEDLSIGQNDFEILTKDSFKGLNYLRKLEISGAANLLKIDQAFEDNLNLEILALTNNPKLSYIDRNALNGLPNLKQLILRDNGFRSFSESLVAWPELRRIDLSGNPIVCECSLMWLRDLSMQRNMTSIECAEPPDLKGKSLKFLSDSDLGCDIYPNSQQTLIGAICGVGFAMLALLIIVFCRYRHKICDIFKILKKKKHVKANGKMKQPEYHKTFSEDEFIIRTAHHQTLKPIPVTEL